MKRMYIYSKWGSWLASSSLGIFAYDFGSETFGSNASLALAHECDFYHFQCERAIVWMVFDVATWRHPYAAWHPSISIYQTQRRLCEQQVSVAAYPILLLHITMSQILRPASAHRSAAFYELLLLTAAVTALPIPQALNSQYDKVQ